MKCPHCKSKLKTYPKHHRNYSVYKTIPLTSNKIRIVVCHKCAQMFTTSEQVVDIPPKEYLNPNFNIFNDK